jgi:hypothetical protein
MCRPSAYVVTPENRQGHDSRTRSGGRRPLEWQVPRRQRKDISSDFSIPNLASAPMPLPNAPAAQTQTWFADNASAAVLLGVCQLLSVLCLGGFAVELRRTASTAAQVAAARRATPWALIAVCGMALSSLFAWILAASASGASLGTVAALFIGHGLNSENRALLMGRDITVILEHDLGLDLRQACRVILKSSARHGGNVEAETSNVRVITPFNLPQSG